jgi:protein-tyrosine-phosphatase
MKEILFICRGNMFRSQVAKAIFNTDPVAGWEAISAGTAVQEENRQGIKLSEYGGGIQLIINEINKKYKKDISDEFCKQVTEDAVKSATKIIMMSEKEYIPEWLDNYEWEYWEIPNPNFITKDLADEIIEMLANKIAILKKDLA